MEWLAVMCSHIPNKSEHMVKYYGYYSNVSQGKWQIENQDGLALIQFTQRVPGSENTVDAFNFTSLLPTAPKLLLNVEIDDYGLIETRSCGCPLESYGFTEHFCVASVAFVS